ncbi:unnamed protein product [Rotaria sp. Silwood2]|nr:unnamed protein product [Rotaria sp. Silwood2]
MSSKLERPSSLHDLIDDIIEPSSSSSLSNPISSRLRNSSKTLQNRNYSSYSSIPSLYDRSKFEQTNNSLLTLTNELRDRAHITLPRSNSSIITMSNDDRRKEIDLIIKHLNDGKLLTPINDDHAVSDVSDPSMHILSKGPITTTTTPIVKNDEENNNNVRNIDFLPLDSDTSTLQRELQEKELDIIHLHKEIQELQLENKLIKAKSPTVYSNGYASNNSETEALRREKDVLQNELRSHQELIAKLQHQQQQNGVINRANKLDDATLYQKEALEKKLKAYEKQMRALTNDNDLLKQHIQQTDRTMTQLKRENEELQQKLTDAKKRNDELLYQEFNSLRNDLKMLKQRNDELFEENHRLQQDHQRQQHNLAWRSTLQQAYANEPQQQISPIDNTVPSSPLKLSNTDSRRERSKVIRSESPNLSEGSDSTNYLTTVSVERYNNRPVTSMHRSTAIDGNNHHQTSRYPSTIGQEEYHRNNYTNSVTKPIDPQLNYRSSKPKRSVEWDEENIQQNEGLQHRNMGNYDNQYRSQRQHPADGTNDYMTPSLPSQSSSSSHLYQQNYGLSRSVTVPESQHQSRRSNSYTMSNRQMNDNEADIHEDRHHGRHRRPSVETTSPRRPYAPTSITDIRLNDIIKFSRPGGKISKGIVKYIGPLPGKNDQYLGLELEDEESKHDGVYQGQRLFQCKPNKGVFVGFSKVIMAWSGK